MNVLYSVIEELFSVYDGAEFIINYIYQAIVDGVMMKNQISHSYKNEKVEEQKGEAYSGLIEFSIFVVSIVLIREEHFTNENLQKQKRI